jgi:nicotinamidase/pyrazinamidase
MCGAGRGRALVVIDYQNDFVDGTLGFPGAEDLEPRIAEKIEEAVADGDDVYFTLDCHGEDYLDTQEGRNLPIGHCMTADGRALHGRIAELAEGHPSSAKSAFGNLELAERMSAVGYGEVELCGLVTNICVISNAVILKSAMPEAVITVDARCVASYDKDLHEKALDVMKGLQISVIGR